MPQVAVATTATCLATWLYVQPAPHTLFLTEENVFLTCRCSETAQMLGCKAARETLAADVAGTMHRSGEGIQDTLGQQRVTNAAGRIISHGTARRRL